MNVLLTGAFGNIGSSALEELLSRGYQVTCFDVKTKKNLKRAQQFKATADIVWGDLRNKKDITAAVNHQEVVIHLAFVIPKLSATGVSSEDNPEFAKSININGTRNLLDVMKEQSRPPKILFTSSLHVYGKTQDQPPPRTVDDIPDPVEHYAKHKIECEQMVKGSGLNWTIFRLGASLPVRLVLDPGMFEVPLDNRIEFIHRKDVGMAIANALQCDQVWGKTWLIGGGPRCQLYQRDLVTGILEAVGVGMLPEDAFTKEPYPTDWLDTTDSQRILNFQRRTLQDYIQDLTSLMGFRRHLIRLFRPIIRAWLLSKSPAWRIRST